jgi:hypothetical protein
MSKLQKSAWVNLAAATSCMVVGGLGTAFLAKVNARGMVYVLVCLIVPCVLGPVAYTWYRKKSLEASFDEREKMIYSRAFTLSAIVLAFFLMGVCTVPFFVLGGQSLIQVYYLPVIFLSTLFTAQFVHSMAIIVQCAREDDDA